MLAAGGLVLTQSNNSMLLNTLKLNCSLRFSFNKLERKEKKNFQLEASTQEQLGRGKREKKTFDKSIQ